jgi:hypothetical protein
MGELTFEHLSVSSAFESRTGLVASTVITHDPQVMIFYLI